MELRPFTKTDWYGWAGAERSAEGEGPLIGYMRCEDWPEWSDEVKRAEMEEQVTVIVDANGIFITGVDEFCSMPIDFEGGRGIMEAHGGKELTVRWLRALKFRFNG